MQRSKIERGGGGRARRRRLPAYACSMMRDDGEVREAAVGGAQGVGLWGDFRGAERADPD
eukprot:COSAG02_NODE_9983_length_2057_cov_85.281410_3_plen_60_part_00